MGEAVISAVRITAAHDGEAELCLTLRFANGGQSLVTLDEAAARALLASSARRSADDLVGVGWSHVRDALIAASNRFVAAGTPQH